MTNQMTAFSNSGGKVYPFKRYFVKDLEEFIRGDFNILFLIGPRKWERYGSKGLYFFCYIQYVTLT